jgi:hypothetical protein
LHVLHILLGLANNVYDNIVAECQAGFEYLTDRYYKLEKQLAVAEADMEECNKENIQQAEFLGNLKKSYREEKKLPFDERMTGMDDDELAADRDDQQAFSNQKDKTLKGSKDDVEKAKKMFDEEAKMAENSKGDGQPMLHRFEEIMKEIAGGVNFADFHGRAMQGPACRRFLDHRVELIAGFHKNMS